MEKKQYAFIDVLRIIACFLVIVNHTNSIIFLSSGPSLTWFASVTYFFVCKVAVPIFVMISGYTMLDRQDDYKKILKKIGRVVLALVLVSLLYYVDAGYMGIRSDLGVKDFLISVFNAPLSNALWYMYLYIGLLIMLPFIQKFVSALNKKDFEIFFGISMVVFSIWPIVEHIVPSLQYSRYVTIPMLDNYICMLMMGCYIKKYAEFSQKKLVGAVIGFFVALAFNIGMTYVEYVQTAGNGYLFYDNRTLLPIVVESVCLFYIVSQVSVKEPVAKILKVIGGCTFGIYLLSDFFIAKFAFVFERLCVSGVHQMLAVLVYEILVFGVGLVVTYMLKMIPGVKKLL